MIIIEMDVQSPRLILILGTMIEVLVRFQSGTDSFATLPSPNRFALNGDSDIEESVYGLYLLSSQ